MISREQARAIATNQGHTVREVFSLEELQAEGVRLPLIYNAPPLDECWIVYLAREPYLALQSAEIVLIARASGEIVYRGSANDEG